jgi:hypothetical protein
VDADDDTLELLDTRAAALDDLHVDVDGVTGTEGRDVGAKGAADELVEHVGHDVSSRLPQVSRGIVDADRCGPVNVAGGVAHPLWQVIVADPPDVFFGAIVLADWTKERVCQIGPP